jgi:Putative 2OG-Fe(II) oxygenase
MEKIELFSSPLWKVKIPPDSYNKKEILDIIEYNYNLQPNRNAVNTSIESNGHNYYRDWNNKNFKELPLDKLYTVYSDLTKEFIQKMEFNQPINYGLVILNLYASRSNQNLKMHDHQDTFYSSIHYLNLKKGHALTRFYNPSIIGQYDSTVDHTKKLVANTIGNSNYFNHWALKVEEDDLVFFPSYLKHDALETHEVDDLRVTIATTIELKGRVNV